MGQTDSKSAYTHSFDLIDLIKTNDTSLAVAKTSTRDSIDEVCQRIIALNFSPDRSSSLSYSNDLTTVIQQAQAIDLTILAKYYTSWSDPTLKELWVSPKNLLRVCLIQGDWISLAKIQPSHFKALTDPAVAAFVFVGCRDAHAIGAKLKCYSDLVTKSQPDFNIEAVLMDSLRQTGLLLAYPAALTAVESFSSWALATVTGQSIWAINQSYRPYLELIKQWLNSAANFNEVEAGNLILTFIRQYGDCPKIFYHMLADFVKVTKTLTADLHELMVALQGLLQQTILDQPDSVKPSQRLAYHHALKTPIGDNILDYCMVLYDRRSCHTSQTWLITLIEQGHLSQSQLEYVCKWAKGDVMIYRALAVIETNSIITKPLGLTKT